MRISFEADPDPADVEAVRRGLEGYNLAHTGDTPAFTPLTLFVRDDDGTIRGGLLGGTAWGWLYIAILWIEDSQRGQGYGQKLVAMAEEIAVERGCQAVHLDTMSFQAPDFYLKLGYTIYGRLDDFPTGHSRIFLYKLLR